MHQSPENSIWYYFSVQFGYWLPSGYSSLSHLTIEDYIWPGSFVEGLVEHVVSRESFHATEKPGHFEFDVQLSRDGAAVRRCYCMGSSQSLVK